MQPMNKNLTRDVDTRSGKWTLSVETGKFPEADPLATLQRVKYDKKFNLRIKQEDIHLLDALAETTSTPRSQILNQLLHEILLEGLREIPDLDVRLLVAETADQRARIDDTLGPWAVEALQTSNRCIRDNVRKFNSDVLDFQEDPNAPADIDYHSKYYYDIQKKLLEVIEK